MFFILSKTLNYLTMPFVLVCMCLLAAIFIKKERWKKRLFWVGFILLFFFSNDFLANEAIRAWEIKPIPFKSLAKHYEIGIVLSGVTITEAEPKDRVFFSKGADRVIHAVQLYKMGYIKKILVSGGSGRLIDIGEREADDIKKAMLVMGVPEQDITTENTSRNTHESAVEVKKILAANHDRPEDCILITSAFHMRRSLACYKKMGLNMDVFSTDIYSHPTKYSFDVLIVPKPEAMLLWQRVMREWTGMVAYKLAGYV